MVMTVEETGQSNSRIKPFEPLVGFLQRGKKAKRSGHGTRKKDVVYVHVRTKRLRIEREKDSERRPMVQFKFVSSVSTNPTSLLIRSNVMACESL